MSIALNKIKGSLERVLDKNLQDLVRGIRNHKDCEVLCDCGRGHFCRLFISIDFVVRFIDDPRAYRCLLTNILTYFVCLNCNVLS